MTSDLKGLLGSYMASYEYNRGSGGGRELKSPEMDVKHRLFPSYADFVTVSNPFALSI